MLDDSLFENISDVDLLREQTQQLIISMSNKIDERFKELDESIESLEKQIATLILGFGEQAVNMEGLIAQIKFASPESQKIFMETIAQSRKQMLEAMKEGAGGLLATESPGVASAIESLADEKLSDGTNQ
jgi:hypothetical protein